MTFPITNEVIYGTSLCDIPTTGMQDDYGTFTWMDPTYVPSVDDAKSPMCYEPSDKKNYDYREVQGYDSKSGNIVRDVVLSVRRKKENCPTFLPDFSQKETNWKSLKLYRIIWNWEISTGQNRKKK